MNFFKKWLIRRRLARLMRPDPDYRERRLAQFSTDRKMRYWLNVRMAYEPSEKAENAKAI